MHRSKGFTLIELVVVIVLLGSLAITAAAKYIDLSKDAKISSLEGMQAAMQSGTDIIFSKAVVENKIADSDTLTTFNGDIKLHSGYPIANWMSGIRYIVNLDDVEFLRGNNIVCQVEWCGRGNRSSIPSINGAISSGKIGKVIPKGYRWRDQCGVYYMNKEDGTKPEIGLETEDC